MNFFEIIQVKYEKSVVVRTLWTSLLLVFSTLLYCYKNMIFVFSFAKRRE